MHCKLKKCRKAAIAGLVAGAGMAASAVSLEPLSGSVINSAEGQDLIMVVRSNSVIRVKEAGMIDLLVVGGGGGGGNRYGGGGGGGGVVYQTNKAVTEGDYEIVIGAGGAGAKNTNTDGGNGGASSAFDVTANGGGGGGTGTSGQSAVNAGGGGAGAWGWWSSRQGGYEAKAEASLPGATGTYNGGACTNTASSWQCYGGGGGGAGGPGGDGSRVPDVGVGGVGGVGVSCAIYGGAQYYGGGGGGGICRANVRPAKGGLGGGGAGGWYNDDGGKFMPAIAGVDFTGGGGGGGSGLNWSAYKGADGGCGIVIIRYRANTTKSITLQDGEASGGEKTVKKHFGIHTFRADGKFTLDRDATLDILLVGGGGGGGSGRGGGGGGGGVMMLTNVFCKAGTYDITVGAGGAQNASGIGSSFVRTDVLQSTQYEVLGGGAGGNGEKATINGKVGASGGGGGCGSHQGGEPTDSTHGVGVGGSGTQYQGHAGGAASGVGVASGFNTFGGGGGGAGAPGGDAFASTKPSVTPHVCGKGGDGLPCDFSGTLCYYGGGGAGGDGNQHDTGTPGGLGGGGVGGHGGNSKDVCTAGGDGEPNTGGGGGGGGGFSWDNLAGGAGGSGIVIVRYNLPKKGLIVILR